MIMKINKIGFLFLFIIFTACKSSFCSREKKILYTNPDSPARVLKISDKKDSLLLRKPSKDVRKIQKNKDLEQLVKKLYLTMLEENGVGIAAPQIGINRNVFLFYRLDKEEKTVELAINPRIISYSPEFICFQKDGCLSVPDKYGASRRYSWIEVEYIDQNKKKVTHKFLGGSRTEDYTGTIFQHEYDHIQGKLYIDKPCKSN